MDLDEEIEDAVLAFLQPSEDCKVVLEATVPDSEPEYNGGSSESDDPNQRFLAVVAHKDPGDGHEEGRLDRVNSPFMPTNYTQGLLQCLHSKTEILE